MRRILALMVMVSLLGLWARGGRAETLELLDGTTVAGDIVLPGMADGLNIHLYTGKYQKVPWDNFSLPSLEKLAKNPDLAQFVNRLINRQDEARENRPEIKVRVPERLELPPKGSLILALFRSPVGLVALILVYAAGIYAGYEIAVVRAHPPLLVCGVSAVAPLVGPIFFLCLPSKMVAPEDEAEGAPPVRESAHAEAQWTPPTQTPPEEEPAPVAPGRMGRSPEAAALPEPQVFAKGQFMFNRRFFETKFPGFFSLVRKDADKHMVLVIRSARGEFEAHRISRITSNELFVDNSASPIPFVEIMEVQLKHEDT